MSIAAIRDTIAMAKSQEQQHHHLAKWLEAHINSAVHMSIQLPDRQPVEALLQFVIAYIDRVPSFLEAATAIAREAEIEAVAYPFLQLAQDFFLKPPEIVAGHVGLHELMDEAYLAHRLMEEVNDRFMLRCNVPLIPMDTTMSNLIIHSVIGEPFANELDEAVQYMVQRCLLNESIFQSPAFGRYTEKHSGDHWEQEYADWPCLLDELPIQLQFAALA